jgi:hypothetical protein
MELPKILQGESRTRLLQGIAIGAIAATIVGFNWGGWVLGSTAAKQAADSSKTAVVAVLTPICVDKFQRAADASNNLDALKKTAVYQQSDFVEKGGWATFSGSDTANSAVAQACANLLGSLK